MIASLGILWIHHFPFLLQITPTTLFLQHKHTYTYSTFRNILWLFQTSLKRLRTCSVSHTQCRPDIHTTLMSLSSSSWVQCIFTQAVESLWCGSQLKQCDFKTKLNHVSVFPRHSVKLTNSISSSSDCFQQKRADEAVSKEPGGTPKLSRVNPPPFSPGHAFKLTYSNSETKA